MSALIVYTITCHCGADAVNAVTDLTNPQPDGTIRIDAEIAIGQSTFECESCGCCLLTGDLEYLTDPPQCRGADEDADGAGLNEARAGQ